MQLKVYISSTYEDLKEYRSIVYDTLRQWRKDVIAMEDYPAAHNRPLQKCLEDVASSDIYVGIFAIRYGYIPKEDNPDCLSITELEYRKAKENGIPILIFLLDENENVAWPAKYVDGSAFSQIKNGEKISKIHNELKQERLVKFFKNKDDLANQVSIAVANQIEIDKSKAKTSFPFLEEHPGKRPYPRVQDNLKDFTGREWIVDEIFNWLESDQRQFFILKGGPGSGKSSLVGWLARNFNVNNSNKKNDINSNNNNEKSNTDDGRDTNNYKELEYIRSIIKGVHYIQFNISGTVNHLVENVASQLATTIKNEDFINYITSLKESSEKKVQSPYDMFYERITKPLKSLYDNYGVSEKTLIIIDALDEEKLDESGNSIVSVLKTLNSDPLFPKNIRFLITTRPVDYILKSFSGQKTFDLSGEMNIKDIKNYISKKLKKEIADKNIEKIIISKLIGKIEKSKNKNNENFLYWSLFIEFIIQHKNEKEFESSLEKDLPSSINEIYSDFLKRIISARDNEWENNYQDLLGIIALQQGQGFSGPLLRKILKRKNENVDINSTITRLRQFLDGNYTIIPGLDLPTGPFHIFHKSFADFLLNEENNNQSFQVNTLKIHKLLVDYCKDKINKINNENDYSNVEDYFIQYLSYHIYQLINNYWKLIENPDVKDIMNELKNEEKKYRKLLYELTVNQSFNQKQKEISVGDNTMILSTIQYALSSAILSDDAPSIAKFMMIHAKKF